MPTDAANPAPGPSEIPPEILDAAIQLFLEDLDKLTDPQPIASQAAEDHLLATHPDADEWAAMKKEEQKKLRTLLSPTDPLAHVPVIEVREGGSTDEGIAGDDWHTTAEEPTTKSLPVAEPDSGRPDEA